jgi:hypothetical protein
MCRRIYELARLWNLAIVLSLGMKHATLFIAGYLGRTLNYPQSNTPQE